MKDPESWFWWVAIVCVILLMGSCTARKIYCEWTTCPQEKSN